MIKTSRESTKIDETIPSHEEVSENSVFAVAGCSAREYLCRTTHWQIRVARILRLKAAAQAVSLLRNTSASQEQKERFSQEWGFLRWVIRTAMRSQVQVRFRREDRQANYNHYLFDGQSFRRLYSSSFPSQVGNPCSGDKLDCIAAGSGGE